MKKTKLQRLLDKSDKIIGENTKFLRKTQQFIKNITETFKELTTEKPVPAHTAQIIPFPKKWHPTN